VTYLKAVTHAEMDAGDAHGGEHAEDAESHGEEPAQPAH